MQPEVGARPDALHVAQAALTGLPRSETIREDLERLLTRNRAIARVEELTKLVDPVLDEVSPKDESKEPEKPPVKISMNERRDDWLEKTSADILKDRELGYRAYRDVKVSDVLDDIATTLARLMRLNEQSDDSSGLRCFVEAWFRETYEQHGEAGKPTQTRFLFEFSVSYRLRRASFLRQRIDHLLRADDDADDMVRNTPDLDRRQPVGAWPAVERAGWNEALREERDAFSARSSSTFARPNATHGIPSVIATSPRSSARC